MEKKGCCNERFCLSHCDDNGWKKDVDEMKIDIRFPARTFKQVILNKLKIFDTCQSLNDTGEVKERDIMVKDWTSGSGEKYFKKCRNLEKIFKYYFNYFHSNFLIFFSSEGGCSVKYTWDVCFWVQAGVWIRSFFPWWPLAVSVAGGQLWVGVPFPDHAVKYDSIKEKKTNLDLSTWYAPRYVCHLRQVT